MRSKAEAMEWLLPPAPRPSWMAARWNAAAGGGVTDRLAWVRQTLRWTDLHHGLEGAATAHVPVNVAQDRVLLDRFGLVRLGATAVSADAWRPEWLGSGAVAADEAHAALPRRPEAAAAGDPVLEAMGFATYRSSGQRGALRAALLAPEGSTLLVVLPTGAGKSLLAHLPPLVEGGLTVVVVPTVALALDQARSLEDHAAEGGVPWGDRPFAYVGGGGARGEAQRDLIRRRVLGGTQRIVFAAPEAVVGGLRWPLVEAARAGHLRRLIVDEAHLVDAWGEDFRPAFQDVAGFRRALLDAEPTLRTVLLSATVTEATRCTLEALFAGGGPFATSCGAQLRPEPSYWVSRAPSEAERTRRVLEAVHRLPRPLILYTSRREDARQWGDRVSREGFTRFGLMTGRTPSSERERLVRQWSDGDIDLMVATSAFGMGIDQPHVRSIVHATLPESLDRYYQEVGRAGRDGHASTSLLVTAPGDLETARSLARRTYLTARVGYERWERLFRTRRTDEPPSDPEGHTRRRR